MDQNIRFIDDTTVDCLLHLVRIHSKFKLIARFEFLKKKPNICDLGESNLPRYSRGANI